MSHTYDDEHFLMSHTEDDNDDVMMSIFHEPYR